MQIKKNLFKECRFVVILFSACQLETTDVLVISIKWTFVKLNAVKDMV